MTETRPDSFPSGHTALTAASVGAAFVVLGSNRTARRLLRTIGVPVVILVGASRVVVGAHFFMDVGATPLSAWGTVIALSSSSPAGRRRHSHPR